MDKQQREKAFIEARAQEQPAVRMTIVGGRPPGSGRGLGEIPRGIEVLVKKASVDPAFNALLMARRSGAADEIGLLLAPQEAAMLDMVPAAQLQAIVANTKVDTRTMPAFLGKAAAVMLVALGASTANSQIAETKGLRPVERPTATAPADRSSEPASQPATQASQPANPPKVRFGAMADQPPATQPTTQPTTQETQPTTQPATEPASQPATQASQPATQTSQPATTQASQPATLPAETVARIRLLLVQLDADNFKKREDAQKQLADMGLTIIPTLIETLNAGKQGLEVNSRLESVVTKAVNDLVVDLASKEQAVRDEAAKKLTAIGPLVVPYLQKAIPAAKLNWETGNRVNTIIVSLGGKPVPVVDNEVRARRGMTAR